MRKDNSRIHNVIILENRSEEDLRMEAHDGYEVIQGQIFPANHTQKMSWTDDWLSNFKNPWIRVMDRYNKVVVEAKLDGRY